MNAQERSAMWDKALELNAVDRAELRVKKFLKTAYAPPVVVVAAFVALGTAQGAVERIFP